MDGKTIWELAMDAFNETGIEIYPPATKNGECKKHCKKHYREGYEKFWI